MERRHHERYRYHAAVTISWTSSHGLVSCPGNCFGASSYGISVETPQFIAAGTRVTIQLDGLEEGVEATICHCRQHGAWYRIGLQLTVVLPQIVRTSAAFC